MDKTAQVSSPLKRYIAIIKYKCPCFRLCEVKRLNFHLNTIETGAKDRDIFVRLIVNKAYYLPGSSRVEMLGTIIEASTSTGIGEGSHLK